MIDYDHAIGKYRNIFNECSLEEEISTIGWLIDRCLMV